MSKDKSPHDENSDDEMDEEEEDEDEEEFEDAIDDVAMLNEAKQWVFVIPNLYITIVTKLWMQFACGVVKLGTDKTRYRNYKTLVSLLRYYTFNTSIPILLWLYLNIYVHRL